jgi:hypothetical protein
MARLVTPLAPGTALDTEQGGTGMDASLMQAGFILGGGGPEGLQEIELVAGAGIALDVSNPAQIVISAGGGGTALNWLEATADAVMTANTGYVNNKVALLTMTLPAVSAVGDQIAIGGNGAGGWMIAQGAGQQINYGNVASTVGAGGSVASTNQYDAIALVCVEANLVWNVISSIGVANVL